MPLPFWSTSLCAGLASRDVLEALIVSTRIIEAPASEHNKRNSYLMFMSTCDLHVEMTSRALFQDRRSPGFVENETAGSRL